MQNIDRKNIEYENLVVEGGGIKGIAHIGVLYELKKMGLLDSFKRYAGCSAGALVCMCLACNIDIDTMKRIIGDKDFNEFQDDSFGYLCDTFRLFTKYGWYKGDELHRYIKNILRDYMGKKNLTFSELYIRTGNTLVVVGSNINRKKSVYFSHQTTPDMNIADAVYISMALPPAFPPREYDGDLCIDGGVFNPYPLWIFDEEGNVNDVQCGNPAEKTLGIKLMSDWEKPDDIINYKRTEIDNLFTYILTIQDCFYTQVERGYLAPGYWEKSILVNTGKLSATDFDIDNDTKEWLIEQGKLGCKEYFK